MTKSYHDSKRRAPLDCAHEEIGERIRCIRTARGLSMRDVTALGGPGVSTQHLAESGLISVHITTLAKLARIFHVRVEEFFIRKDCEIDEVAAMIYRMTDKDLRELRQKLERKVVN